MVELVFAVGVIVLVLTGVVVLLVKTMGSRTEGLERKKAVKVAEVVIENLVEEKTNKPADFWQLSSVEGQELDEFEGFVYSVGFTNVVNGLGCGVDALGAGVTDCAMGIIKVGWSSGDGWEELEMQRFFSR